MASVIELLVQLKDEASSKFDLLLHGVSELTGVVDLLHATILGLASGAVIGAIETMVAAFAEGELAVTRLNAALRVSGQYTHEGSKEIQDMAAHMQDLTTTSQTAAIQISATIGAIAKDLTAGQLAQMQRAAIGLAEAHGVSVERASMMIARSLTGQGNALHRWGVDLDTSASQQEKANVIIAKTAGLFDIATASAQTLSGRIQQAKNEWHDLEQTLGEVIARSIGLDEKTTTLRDTLRSLNAEVRAHGMEAVQFIQRVIEVFKLVGTILVAVTETIVGVFVSINDAGGVLVGAIRGAVEVAFTFVVNFLIDILNGIFEKIDEVAAHFHMSFKVHLAKLSSDGAWDGMKKDLSALKADVSAIGSAWDDVGAAVDRVVAKSGPVAKPVLPGFGDAGGGPNIGTPGEDKAEQIRMAMEQQKLLDAEFKVGTVTQEEYQAATAQTVATLIALRDRGQKPTRQEQIQLNEAIAKYGELAIVISPAVKELSEREKQLTSDYQAGRITLEQYIAKRKELRQAITDEIKAVEQLIASNKLSHDQLLEAKKLLQELLGLLNNLGGAAKKFGDAMKESLGAGTTEPIADVHTKITQMAAAWEKASASSAAAALISGENVGRALQKVAKQYEEMALADALYFTAHGIFDSFFNPGKAAKDFAAAAEALASAAAYALIAGGGGGSAGGGGGAGGGGLSAAQQQTNAVTGMTSGVNIYLPTGFPNSQAFLDELVSNIEQAGARGVHVVPQG